MDSSVLWLHVLPGPYRCVYSALIGIRLILTNATLARWNSALPDDGDYTEVCWSCCNSFLMSILKLFLAQFNCASVGK